MDRLGAVLGPYGAVLEASTLEIADIRKTWENLGKSMICASPGLVRGVLWDVLEAAEDCLGLSWVV